MTATAFSAPVSAPLFRQCRSSLGNHVLRLQDEPRTILKNLHQLGGLVVTTFASGGRISQAMHYPTVDNEDWHLDCRAVRSRVIHELDISKWCSVMAVLAPVADLTPRSLVFFDQQRRPLQQIAAAPESGGLAFEKLVCAMLHRDQCFPDSSCDGAAGVTEERPDAMACVDQLERRWTRSDDESFQALLAQAGNRRAALYQAVRDKFACPARIETVASVLQLAARSAQPLTITAGNDGVRLTLSAPWSVPRWQGSCCHLAHGGAMLSLDMGRVASLWRLRRPGAGCVVTELEALDTDGRWLWTLSAGAGEEQPWRQLLKRALIDEGQPGSRFA